jgi:hypothetical protein
MRISNRIKVLLAGACIMAGPAAWGQQDQSSTRPTKGSLEVALVYNPLMSNVVGGNSFWMQGGSVQVHGRFWRGLGVVADVSGLHTANASASPGVGLDLVTAAFGPRYTWSPSRGRYAVFGQVLAGEANGLHSVFPAAGGANDSADSLALYVGGGVNLPLKNRFALRAIEANWLRTQLPNATTNVQNNLRLGAGLIYTFK